MKCRRLITYFFIFLNAHCFGQKNGLINFQKQNIYLSIGNNSNEMAKFITQNNLGIVTTINGKYIYKENSWDLDSAALKQWIEKTYPDTLQTAICALDWEGKGIEILKNNQPNDSDFKNALNNFMTAIKLVK